jgi:galactokinase
MKVAEHVASIFREKFKGIPTVIIAPGRINLIGEHTDYNEGFVMPAAVDKYLAFAIRRSGDDRCNIYATDFDEGVTFSINDLNPGEAWINYLMGVLDAFQRRGLKVKGVDCVFGGNIPTGAGLSSSAALCSGFAFAINELYKFGLSRLELAKIAQSSENNFIGVMCGIMDEYASLFGHKNSALLLDCRSLTHEQLDINWGDHEILLIDTKVKHSLASSAYNERRASCEEGVAIIREAYPHVRSLRDVSKAMLLDCQPQLPAKVFIKCRFIVEEIDRTQQAARVLKAGDLVQFGDLMYQAHWGLSKDYEVSCEESDFLVDLAEKNRAEVAGARQTGGGFGGCTINIIRRSFTDVFMAEARKKYFASFKKEPDFYSVNLSDGVHPLKP